MRANFILVAGLAFSFHSNGALAKVPDPPWVECYKKIASPEDPSLVGPDLNAAIIAYRRDKNFGDHQDANRFRIQAWANYGEAVDQCASKSKIFLISPFAYDALDLLSKYQNRQSVSPSISKSILYGGDLSSIGISLFTLSKGNAYGALASFAALSAHALYEFSGHEKEYDLLESALEKELEFRIRNDSRPPQELLSEFAKYVDSDDAQKAFGVVTNESRQIVSLAVARILQEYAIKQKYDYLKSKATILSDAQANNLRAQAKQQVRLELARSQANRNQIGANLAEELRIPAKAVISSESVGETEKRVFEGLTPKQRNELLNAFKKLSPGDQKSALAGDILAFERLKGLNIAQVVAMEPRAVRQLASAEAAESWRQHSVDARALANIATTFKIGGPDFVPSLVLGANLFDQGAKMMDIASKLGNPSVSDILAFASTGSVIISAIQVFSGGRSNDDQQAIRMLSAQIAEMFGKLTKQIADNQKITLQGIARLDSKIDALLLLNNSAFNANLAKCKPPSILVDTNKLDRSSIFLALKDGAVGELHIWQCAEFLKGYYNTSFTNFAEIRLDTTQINQLSLNGAFASPQLKNFNFDQAQYFVTTTYDDAYMRLAENSANYELPTALDGSHRRLTLFELANVPTLTVKQLDSKLVAIDQTAPGPEMGDTIKKDVFPDWDGADTLLEALKTPVAVSRTNLINLGLDHIAPYYVYMDDQGHPMGNSTPTNNFKEMVERRTQMLKSLFGYYAPLAMQASAQETIMTGDFLLPRMAKALKELDCSQLADQIDSQNLGADGKIQSANGGPPLNDIQNATLATCRVLQTNPVIRQNLLMWELRSPKSPWLENGGKLKNLGAMRIRYSFALSASDRLQLDQIIDPDRLLPIESQENGRTVMRFYYRIAGDCAGVQKEVDLNNTFRPNTASLERTDTRPLGVAGVTPEFPGWERNRLKACISAPLPDAESMYAGRFELTPSTQLAHWLKDRLTRQAFLRAMASSKGADPHKSVLIKLMLKED